MAFQRSPKVNPVPQKGRSRRLFLNSGILCHFWPQKDHDFESTRKKHVLGSPFRASCFWSHPASPEVFCGRLTTRLKSRTAVEGKESGQLAGSEIFAHKQKKEEDLIYGNIIDIWVILVDFLRQFYQHSLKLFLGIGALSKCPAWKWYHKIIMIREGIKKMFFFRT